MTLSKEKNRIKSDRIEVKGEVQEAMDKAAADTAANGTDTEDDMEDDMETRKHNKIIIWHGYL